MLILQGQVLSGYSKHAHSFINQRLLGPVWRRPGYLRQLRSKLCAVTSCCSTVNYHALLFKLLVIVISRAGVGYHCSCVISWKQLEVVHGV